MTPTAYFLPFQVPPERVKLLCRTRLSDPDSKKPGF
jgi:hypothetical protein